jgi:hypothetical protein
MRKSERPASTSQMRGAGSKLVPSAAWFELPVHKNAPRLPIIAVESARRPGSLARLFTALAKTEAPELPNTNGRSNAWAEPCTQHWATRTQIADRGSAIARQLLLRLVRCQYRRRPRRFQHWVRGPARFNPPRAPRVSAWKANAKNRTEPWQRSRETPGSGCTAASASLPAGPRFPPLRPPH